MATWLECVGMLKNNNHQQLQKQVRMNLDLVSLKDEADWNLLMLSVSATYDAYECSLVLIEHGADVNIVNKYGRTILMVAIVNKNLRTATLLLEYGADLSARDNEGESAFEIATRMKRKEAAWFELFSKYKDRFDEKDLALYHELRLRSLFTPNNN
jgi:ankyrin repeat protein